MDLLDTWKRLQQEKLEKPISGAATAPSSSKHPVATLKRNYFIKIALIVLFLVAFLILFFYFDHIYIRVSLGIVCVSYIIFLVSAYTTYKKISVELPIEKSLKTALIHTKSIIETNLRFEERAGIVVYPFAATSGFLMGFAASGGNASSVFSENFLLLTLLIMIAVLTPLCYFLARWMYKVTYGKCLSDLKAMIADLESDL